MPPPPRSKANSSEMLREKNNRGESLGAQFSMCAEGHFLGMMVPQRQTRK